MWIRNAVLVLALVGSCAAVDRPVGDALVREGAALSVLSRRYQAIDCADCGDCVAMRASIARAASVAPVLDPNRPEEEIRRALDEVEAAAASMPATCACPQDATICAPTRGTLVAYDEMADETRKNLDRPARGTAFGGGIWDAIKRLFGGGDG